MRDAAALKWRAEDLWRELKVLLPDLSVEVVARCESTNTRLIERARRSGGSDDAAPSRPGELEPPISGPMPLAGVTPHGRRAGDTQPCLLVAEEQTRGRGRMGRSWLSKAGASLTFSLALPFDPPDWSGLSLAIGVALADALDPRPDMPGPHLALKWPNDLMWVDGSGAGRKMGGVLVETVPVGQRRMAVIGVGLNIAPQAYSDLSSGFACLQEIDPGIDAPTTLARIARPLIQAVLEFQRTGFAPFKPRFERRDYLAGRAVTTNTAGLPGGIAGGIDAGGAMRLRVGDTVHTLDTGEVSLRADPSEPPC
jgi:BirA family transcriptional regulator, biotin operon repressor / biotin---[acetyl-CoA-carboxylase] ligase